MNRKDIHHIQLPKEFTSNTKQKISTFTTSEGIDIKSTYNKRRYFGCRSS